MGDEEELTKLLKRMDEKLDKSEKRQNELEIKLSEMEKVLSVKDEDVATDEPEKSSRHDDSDVHTFIREIKKEREEKKRKKDERLHVKSERELDEDSAKLLEKMLHGMSDEEG